MAAESDLTEEAKLLDIKLRAGTGARAKTLEPAGSSTPSEAPLIPRPIRRWLKSFGPRLRSATPAGPVPAAKNLPERQEKLALNGVLTREIEELDEPSAQMSFPIIWMSSGSGVRHLGHHSSSPLSSAGSLPIGSTTFYRYRSGRRCQRPLGANCLWAD